MSKQRFVIESNGIWDNGKLLSWGELCEVLNQLDNLANNQLNEYEYIVKIEYENQLLKEKLISVSVLLVKIYEHLGDMKTIINYGEKNERE